MMQIISRKERQVQKALGLGDDMPPTIYYRISYWVRRHITCYTYKWTGDNFWQWFAFKLPKKLVYHCTIRAWAHATTCAEGRNEVAFDTTVDNALKRWEKNG